MKNTGGRSRRAPRQTVCSELSLQVFSGHLLNLFSNAPIFEQEKRDGRRTSGNESLLDTHHHAGCLIRFQFQNLFCVTFGFQDKLNLVVLMRLWRCLCMQAADGSGLLLWLASYMTKRQAKQPLDPAVVEGVSCPVRI